MDPTAGEAKGAQEAALSEVWPAVAAHPPLAVTATLWRHGSHDCDCGSLIPLSTTVRDPQLSRSCQLHSLLLQRLMAPRRSSANACPAPRCPLPLPHLSPGARQGLLLLQGLPGQGHHLAGHPAGVDHAALHHATGGWRPHPSQLQRQRDMVTVVCRPALVGSLHWCTQQCPLALPAPGTGRDLPLQLVSATRCGQAACVGAGQRHGGCFRTLLPALVCLGSRLPDPRIQMARDGAAGGLLAPTLPASGSRGCCG